DVLLTVAAELGGPVQAALPWPSLRALLREGAQALQAQAGGNVQAPDFERFWVQLLQQGGWWTTSPATGGAAPGGGSPSALAAGRGRAAARPGAHRLRAVGAGARRQPARLARAARGPGDRRAGLRRDARAPEQDGPPRGRAEIRGDGARLPAAGR